MITSTLSPSGTIDATATDQAITELVGCTDVGSVGQAWRERAATHLTRDLHRYLRQGLPLEMPTSEERAMVIIKDIAGELLAAADALGAAAKQLKDDGKGYRASQAYQASLRAREIAEGLVGHA